MSRATETVSRRAVIKAANSAGELLNEMQRVCIEQAAKIEEIRKASEQTQRVAADAKWAANDSVSSLTAFDLKTDTFWHRLRWLMTGQ